MQKDPKLYPWKPASPIAYDLGGYTYNIPVAPPGDPMPGPAHGMGINTTNATKSFIIFDQTDNKCRIMFYPSPANKFSYPNFDFNATYPLKCGKSQENYVKASSSLKEDTKDIDALLSLDYDEETEDDEEVSTGRTMGNNYGNSSPDSSCSTDGSKSSNSRLSFMDKSCCSGSSGERGQQKMKKLMKVLRGIVPGGDQMDAAAVLDEAVIHLKSLKMEVKKLGIRNLKKHG
ncbi:transcription factor bHLH144-like [Aristolochia californica]|uniref:transcription factor bHLH144-like n=1 Tax=Aristolochia californica TaxID=171875 RepID=UPI0035DB42B6